MSRWSRQPLRVRLVALLVALVGVALLVSGLVATTLLRGYLVDRVDQQLLDAARPFAGGPPRAPLPAEVAGADGPAVVPPGRFWIRYTDATGGGDRLLSAPADSGTPDVASPTIAQARAVAGETATVASVDGAGPSWRVTVVPLADGSGSVTVASSLADVSATVTLLAGLEAVVGLVTLLAVAGLGWVSVRRSLRPLVEVERVAGRIAHGELDQRVPGADERTEVGQLAGAFNTMVDRIQVAFEAQRAAQARAEESAGRARASEDRMRRFVADASHELRTPLTSIRGFAELYRQGAVSGPAELDRAMGRIEGEADRMGLLVDDLLLLARLDQQRPIDRVPVDLVAVAADAVHDASMLAPDREVALSLADGPWPPVVLGDEARLRQVVANLVGNAVRHTPPGSRVDVRVRVEGDPPHGWVVLEVADTGPGLTPEQAARVFERFYRADGARSRGDGGTGLGLAIVAALVEAHGGRVELETAPGAGATFRVLLPAA